MHPPPNIGSARVEWLLLRVISRRVFSAPFVDRYLDSDDGVAWDVTCGPFADYFAEQGVPDLTPHAACNLNHRAAEEIGVDELVACGRGGLMGRRPDGALERDVMEVLWRADEPLTPAEVREQLDVDLAYTTVMTVLGRLNDKGRAHREQRGRAFAYSAAVSESELTAKQMNAVLCSATDRVGALGGFVGGMSKGDRAALRRLLGGRGRSTSL